jgi:hypothetical protein
MEADFAIDHRRCYLRFTGEVTFENFQIIMLLAGPLQKDRIGPFKNPDLVTLEKQGVYQV